MTKLGCPVALPRLTSLPFDRTMIFSIGEFDLVDLRLDLGPLHIGERADLISLSK